MPLGAASLPVAFTLSEALEVGASRHRLHRAVRAGTLWQPARSIYVDATSLRSMPWPDRHRALARAAALHVPDSALSHVTAALMLGLPNPRLVHLMVTFRPRVNRRSDWVHLHRAALPAAQLVTRDSLVLTGVERTVVDCCRKLHVTEAVAIADAALRSQMTMPKQLVEACHAQHRWPGVAAARRALESVDARRETWPESVSAAAMHLAGVPFGVPQVEALTWEGEFLGRVDFLWLETGVIGEADGYGKLLGTVEPSSDESPTAVARRVIALGERSARLTEAGFGVFHWSPVDLRNQGATLALRYYAAARRAQPGRTRAILRCSCCHADLAACERRPGVR